MMKNDFYFTLKAFFVLKMFKFFSQIFRLVEKTTWLERWLNFKIHDFTTWLSDNFNTHIAKYLTK